MDGNNPQNSNREAHGVSGNMGIPGNGVQIMQQLMRMTPEQRNATISKNPQLKAFLMHMDQRRRMHMQQQAQQQQMAQQQAQAPTSTAAQTQPQTQTQAQAQAQVSTPREVQIPLSQKYQPQQQPPQQIQHTIPSQAYIPQVPLQQQLQQPQYPQQHPQQQQQQQQQQEQRVQQQHQFEASDAFQTAPPQQAPGREMPPILPIQKPVSASTSETMLNNQSSLPIGPLPDDLDHINRDQIPKRPLQKKGLKRKALSNGSINADGHAPDGIEHQDEGHDDKSMTSLFDDFDAPFLRTTHDWSQEMAKNGLEPTADVRIYEDMTTKDLQYQKYIGSIMKAAKSNDRNVNESVGINGRLMKRLLGDLSFYQQVKAARMQSMMLPPSANELTSSMWGEGYSGYGSGFTHGKVEFVFPAQSQSARYGVGDEDIELGKLVQNASSDDDVLIPIRLEFDVDRDGFRLVDTFVWNSGDSDEMLNIFVEELIRDFEIEKNLSGVKEKILHSMREQISEQQPTVENPQIDLRFPISLDITIANNQLTDKFDWDLMNKENDPEEFAETLCIDLALPFEFRTAIAHSIREQCQIYLKSLYLIGYKFDGGAIISEDLKEYLRSGVDQNNIMLPRYLLSDFSASVQELSLDNLEKIAKERERESKRRKRGGATRVGRRGGFVLPDLSNMPKTLRTPIPGATLPGSIVVVNEKETGEDETPLEDHFPYAQTTSLKQALLVDQREQITVRRWLGRIQQQRMSGYPTRVAVSSTADKDHFVVSVSVKQGDAVAGAEEAVSPSADGSAKSEDEAENDSVGAGMGMGTDTH